MSFMKTFFCNVHSQNLMLEGDFSKQAAAGFFNKFGECINGIDYYNGGIPVERNFEEIFPRY